MGRHRQSHTYKNSLEASLRKGNVNGVQMRRGWWQPEQNNRARRKALEWDTKRNRFGTDEWSTWM